MAWSLLNGNDACRCQLVQSPRLSIMRKPHGFQTLTGQLDWIAPAPFQNEPVEFDQQHPNRPAPKMIKPPRSIMRDAGEGFGTMLPALPLKSRRRRRGLSPAQRI